MIKSKTTLFAAALLAGTAAMAQTKAPEPATAVEFSGYLDASYNRLSESNMFTSGVANRVFDVEERGAAIRQLAGTVAYQPKQGLGGLVNVTLGKDADVIHAFGAGAGKTNQIDLTQAFGQYAMGPFTVIGGKYVTLAGAEVINSPSNANFSRSILFGYAIPFTHTGVRGTYAFDDATNLIVGVNNGWDNFKDTNGSKTLELGLTYAPSEAISLAAQAYLGRERVGGLVDFGPEGARNLIDLVGTYKASEKLSFVLNFDYGTQQNAPLSSGGNGRAKWTGIAGYVTYQLNDQWRLSGRAEVLDDTDGYRTGVAQKWKEATFTVGYLPTKAIELRAEVRADSSNVSSFVTRSGASATNKQRSFGLQALYKF